MSIRLVEESKPFVIPPDLKEILTSMPLEYGSGGGVGDELPAARFWTVKDEGGTAGYAWLAEHAGPDGTEFHINIATLPNRKRCGIASCALSSVEQTLRAERVPVLYGQVNSNKAETGLWVREWLLRRGFELLRRDIPKRYASLGDAELARTYPCPVYFRKVLIKGDAQPSLQGTRRKRRAPEASRWVAQKCTLQLLRRLALPPVAVASCRRRSRASRCAYPFATA